jgi:NADH-quinone oxidoreductase E subunit
MASVEAAERRYPRPQAALLPILQIIQTELGYIPVEAEIWAAERLGLPPVRVREVMSFYTLLRRRKPGRHIVQVCRNLSCTLNGAEDLLSRLAEKWGVRPGETSADGRFSLLTVECLGNCPEAPCLQVDDADYGKVTAQALEEILTGLD